MTYIYQKKLESEKKEDARVTRTKRELADALVELLTEYSYDQITVKEICNQALISKLTFYNNFLNKNELMFYVLQRGAEKTIKNLKKRTDLVDTLNLNYRELIKKLITLFYSDNSPIRTIISNDHNKALYPILYTFLKQYIAAALTEQNSKLTEKIPPNVLASYYAGAMIGLIYNLALEDFTDDYSSICDYIYILTTSTLFSGENNLSLDEKVTLFNDK